MFLQCYCGSRVSEAFSLFFKILNVSGFSCFAIDLGCCLRLGKFSKAERFSWERQSECVSWVVRNCSLHVCSCVRVVIFSFVPEISSQILANEIELEKRERDREEPKCSCEKRNNSSRSQRAKTRPTYGRLTAGSPSPFRWWSHPSPRFPRSKKSILVQSPGCH